MIVIIALLEVGEINHNFVKILSEKSDYGWYRQ